MRRVSVVGIGSGDPDDITIAAIKALNASDVFFVIDKPGARADLVALRREILERYVEGAARRTVLVRDPERDRGADAYAEAVEDWRRRRADVWEALIAEELADGERGAFLVWGDPALYDSTIAVLDDVAARGAVAFELDVVPGISAIASLTARHADRAEPRRRAGPDHDRPPARARASRRTPTTSSSCSTPAARFARSPVEDLDIYWGAYLGTEDEILVAGRLADVADEIVRVRAEARERKGWIMDTYLLRRTAPRSARRLNRDPLERVGDGRHGRDVDPLRAAHDDDRQAALAGRVELGDGVRTAAVLRDDEVDVVRVDERELAVELVRPAVEQQLVVGRQRRIAADRRSGRETRRRRRPRTRPAPGGRSSAGPGARALAAAASARSSTHSQRSPSRSLQPGRSRRSSGTPACGHATAADAEMRCANGCVASTTAAISCSSIQRASSSGPPKPPIRVSPAGSRGLATRPASDEITGTPASSSAAASSRASAVPPRTRIIAAEPARCARGAEARARWDRARRMQIAPAARRRCSTPPSSCGTRPA